MIPEISDLLVEPVIRMALAEDLGRAGDLTSDSAIDADAHLAPVAKANKNPAAGH